MYLSFRMANLRCSAFGKSAPPKDRFFVLFSIDSRFEASCPNSCLSRSLITAHALDQTLVGSPDVISSRRLVIPSGQRSVSGAPDAWANFGTGAMAGVDLSALTPRFVRLMLLGPPWLPVQSPRSTSDEIPPSLAPLETVGSSLRAEYLELLARQGRPNR